MSLLLDTAAKDIIIPLIIVATILVISGLIIFGLKRIYGKDRGMITKSEPKIVNVELKKHFIGKPETQFLKNIYKILPAEFVAFPMVGVDCLVSPKGDKVLYNTILSQYVDVCIFLKDSMQPVLAIDLFEPSPVEQQMKQLHPNVKKALSTVGIPLMTYQLSEGYSIVELRSKIIDAMPPKIVAMLKDKVKNDNSGL